MKKKNNRFTDLNQNSLLDNGLISGYTTPGYTTSWWSMDVNVSNNILSTPETYITVGQHRKKLYDDNTVYLENNTNFELEIFNENTDTVYASININGKTEPNYLVIKPGQRIFVERYIESNNKLKFSTYNVEDNNTKVDDAIKNNGTISILYYSEATIDNSNNIFYNTASGNNTSGNFNINTGNTTSTTFTNCSHHIDSVASLTNSFAGKMKGFKETGSVEKGVESNQHFDKIYRNIRLQYVGSRVINIKPESTHTKTQYCTACGVKQRKTSWKFCPSCGKAY